MNEHDPNAPTTPDDARTTPQHDPNAPGTGQGPSRNRTGHWQDDTHEETAASYRTLAEHLWCAAHLTECVRSDSKTLGFPTAHLTKRLAVLRAAARAAEDAVREEEANARTAAEP